MPIDDFPGRRNWGYDGVLPFAPDRCLRDTRRLEGADRRRARARPDGLSRRGLQSLRPGRELLCAATRRNSFATTSQTPWGAAIDFRQAQVRRFFIENALYWLMEFRFDGLRSMRSTRSPTGLARRNGCAGPRRPCEKDRHVHLVLEHDGNDRGSPAARLRRASGTMMPTTYCTCC